MSGRKALLLVWISSVAGGLGGSIIGWLLGTRAPDYYFVVFDADQRPRFDPESVGIGLGLTQGIGAGFVGGLVIVFLLVWREIRLTDR